MKKRRMLSRLCFAALALVIVAGVPLSAKAESTAYRENTRPATVTVLCGAETGTVAAVPTRSEFLHKLSLETDSGRPLDGTTRAQYIQILYRAAGSPKVKGILSFIDVSPAAEYADALLWAQESGVARKDHRGRFRPDEAVTTENAQEFLSLALAALGESAQQVANSLLAAYLGKVNEEDWALLPAALAEALDHMVNQDIYSIEYPSAISAAPPWLTL